jgi:large conductance mechanosensitive channel
MLKDFKQFVARGNAIELAIAVVMGVAFAAVINALVADLITPLIAAIVGKPDFSNLTFTVHRSVFKYGAFLNAVISFLLIAAAVFFFVIRPLNAFTQRMRKDPSPDPTTRKCPECLSEIPAAARRCAFCTSEVNAPA